MAKFYGIGIGPGDSELVTVKAARILAGIDAVLLPEARSSKGSIAYDIAKEYINPRAELVYSEFPMTADTGVINLAGVKAAAIVEKYIKEGKNIAFITLGDPSIYSTYGYILRNLAGGIEIETIPGITSFCASAASLNRLLVEGEEVLSIIPATASVDKIDGITELSDGMAYMKVYSNSDKLVNLLEKHELLDKSVLVKRCGMEDCSVETDVRKGLSQGRQYLSIVLARKEKR